MSGDGIPQTPDIPQSHEPSIEVPSLGVLSGEERLSRILCGSEGGIELAPVELVS